MDESDQACFMVQGIDSLKIHSDAHLNDSSSSSCDNNVMDAHALNEELSMFCETLLSKYKTWKSKSFDLKEENKNLFSKLDLDGLSLRCVPSTGEVSKMAFTSLYWIRAPPQWSRVSGDLCTLLTL